MKDRFISLLGALIALYIVIVIFFNPQISDLVEHSIPTSVDQGKYGLKGLYKWLEQSKVPVYRLQRRYSDLENLPNLNKRGNLMIISLPQINPAHDREIDDLQRWVKQGNQLLILAVPGSRNKFLQRFGFRLQRKNKETTSLEENKDKKVSLSEMTEDFGKEITVELTRRAGHPLTANIRKVHGRTLKLSPSRYTLVSASSFRSSLALLQDNATSLPAFWETRYKNSRVWVSRFAHIFSNAQLAQADNAKLVTNIIDAALSGGGSVIFDDMHQGSTELYDQDAFFSDSRLHITLWFIFAFWVLYVIGHTNRIAPLATHTQPARVSDYIYAMAGLFARRLSKISAAKLLFNHFFDWIRLKYSMPTNGQPVWQLLETTERINRSDLEEIKQKYIDLQNNKKVNLMKLANKMQKMRSALS